MTAGDSDGRRLYVATGNAHKAREIQQILAPFGWDVAV